MNALRICFPLLLISFWQGSALAGNHCEPRFQRIATKDLTIGVVLKSNFVDLTSEFQTLIDMYGFYVTPYDNRRLLVNIPDSDDRAWLHLFSEMSFVEGVCPGSLKLASADSNFAIDWGNPIFVHSEKGGFGTDFVSSFATSIRTFVESFYEDRGETRIERFEEFQVKATVTNLKGEIIRKSPYWEKLELNFILVSQYQETKVFLVTDGYYASGLGEEPPSYQGYKYMDKEHESVLQSYTEALLTELLDWIIAVGKPQ